MANIFLTQAQLDSIITAINSRAKTAEKGVANGLATLDSTGLIPVSQIPTSMDDVLEYATLATFPVTGIESKVYIDQATNKQYRWTGTAYVLLSGASSTSDSSTKLTTARTISLSGDAMGNCTFDGSANVSITVTISDDSHAHSFTNLTSKPTTKSGYGITDVYSKTETDALFTSAVITALVA